MAQVPAGAQRSEDGYYWWNGSAWQQIPEDERDSGASGGTAGTAGTAGTTSTAAGTATGTTTGTGTDTTAAAISHDELAQITSAEQLDDRSKPYFQPDADMYPDDASDAEGADVLSDEPAADTTGGTA